MVSLHLYILYYIWLIFEGKCTEIYHTVDGMFFCYVYEVLVLLMEDKSQTITWDVGPNCANNGINYQPQLVGG